MTDYTDDLFATAEHESKLNELRAWVKQLNDAADAYYNGRGELMTDFEWDALFDKVKARETELSLILPDSPTNKVSADNVIGQKETHEFAALSLAKTKNIAEVVKWAEQRPIWVSWKLDGLTLVVTYDDGRLTKVVTRGDGHIGTNITHLASGIIGIPQQIKAAGHVVVRGEAVIAYSDFKAFLAESQEEYANPRNLASGSLTLKDVNELAARRLQWIPFTLVAAPDAPTSWGAQLDWLDSIGLKSVARQMVIQPTEATLNEVIAQWTQKVTSGANPFPVDGLVITYDDTAYARTGSITGHHATRAGFAFKWADETAATELEYIEWSCAVNSISPVAVFKPVQLEGTQVKRASLVNISECERLGIGGAGSCIEVIKANKIIPKVIAVTAAAGALQIPETCPVCAAPTRIDISSSGTRKLCCTNPHCPARELRKFIRFVARDAMDIMGLGAETLAKFINCGWLKTVADIFRLGEHAEAIAQMEGFGAKSAANITAAITTAAQNRSAVRLFTALAIPQYGTEAAKLLLGAHSGQGIAQVFAKARAAEDTQLFANIDGLGPVRSAAFIEWCKDDENWALAQDIFSLVKVEEFVPPAATGSCAGLTFVITGDVHHFKNRNEFKAFVEQQGGHVASTVTGATNFLVNNDAASTSSKNKKAQALNIPIITEDEFVQTYGGGNG